MSSQKNNCQSNFYKRLMLNLSVNEFFNVTDAVFRVNTFQ